MLPVMLPRSAETDASWQELRRHAGLDHYNYAVGSFGDSPEMASELADLAIAGITRATASLARDYCEGREPTPTPGDSRDWWLNTHRRYYGRQARREGFEIDDEILTVFERFEVVCPLDIADMTARTEFRQSR
jgi:uncharacterized protein YhfF